MATRSVQCADEQHSDRWWVLLSRRHLWLLIALAQIVGYAACAPLTRLRPYDPDKDFAYGLLEHREPGDALVVTRATIELHDTQHALVLDPTLDDQMFVCTERRSVPPAQPPVIQACTRLARLRQLIEDPNAAK